MRTIKVSRQLTAIAIVTGVINIKYKRDFRLHLMQSIKTQVNRTDSPIESEVRNIRVLMSIFFIESADYNSLFA
jgi:hypothetical protein